MDSSFDDFVVARGPSLTRLAYAMTGDPHDAADLVQETLARMGERWSPGRFDDPAAYAVTVLSRLNVDRLRRWRRETPGLFRVDAAAEPTPDVDAPWLLPALATLSPRQRTALALRFVEDLDVRGIADRLGCAEGTAKSHLSRGLARLQEAARAAGALTPPPTGPTSGGARDGRA